MLQQYTTLTKNCTGPPPFNVLNLLCLIEDNLVDTL